MKRMLENVTSWSQYYKLMESDQPVQATTVQPAAAPAQPVQQPAATPATEVPTPVATVAPVTPTATEQTVTNTAGDTTTTPVEPTQPAAMTAPAQPAAQSQIVAQTQAAAQPAAPVQESMNATSWEEYNKLNESIAFPGGCMDVKPTDYEKELDKHNKDRKNNKVVGEVGDKDAGEAGVHDFDEKTGVPTGKLDSVLNPRKSSKLILQGAN